MTTTKIDPSDEFVYHVHQFVIRAALDLLPAKMSSPQARAMLLAIGLQESRFKHRQQIKGPAHGFWQFEKGGAVKGVLTHASTRPLLLPILELLRYKSDAQTCYDAIVDNDTLACIFARLLLWTVPGKLPVHTQEASAWSYYIEGWRPGKPHQQRWHDCFQHAWKIVATE